jgi:hypothetical protein
MTRAILTSVVLILSFALTGCGSGSPENTSFEARPGEKPFNVAYHYTGSLPVSEESFIGFLRLRGLSYEISSGQGAMVADIDPPQLKKLSMSTVRSTYDIYDKSRSTAHQVVHYIAYVNHGGQVIYVENRFQYRGM